MQKQLFDALSAKGTPGDWSHIIKQIGMSTFIGLIRTRTNTTPQNIVYVFYDANHRQHAKGVNYIRNMIQSSLDKRLAMWEKYCLCHCFTVPEGFSLPKNSM
uniref:Uncharacterized protein n=1 Tax=Gossypium raimondii TaxID=29730 RepID=A0A0D2VJQ7_GOSRA|nr:hypothetical protein B456_N008500 [Gossypium raimondii]